MMLSLTLAYLYYKNLWRSVNSLNVLFDSAQELELEDTQSRLQQDLRQRMSTDGKFYYVTVAVWWAKWANLEKPKQDKPTDPDIFFFLPGDALPDLMKRLMCFEIRK